MKICNHEDLLALWNVWRCAQENAANAKTLYVDAVEYVREFGYDEPVSHSTRVSEQAETRPYAFGETDLAGGAK